MELTKIRSYDRNGFGCGNKGWGKADVLGCTGWNGSPWNEDVEVYDFVYKLVLDTGLLTVAVKPPNGLAVPEKTYF